MKTLSEKEKSTIEYLAQGLSHRDIAKKLFMSRSSFEFFLYTLRVKCNCSNSTQLVAHYYENKINGQNIDDPQSKTG